MTTTERHATPAEVMLEYLRETGLDLDAEIGEIATRAYMIGYRDGVKSKEPTEQQGDIT